MKVRARTLWHLIRPGAGLVVWSSAFVWLYAGVSLGCRHLPVPDPAAWLNAVSILLLLIAIAHAAVLLVLLVGWRRRAGCPTPDGAALYRIEGLVLLISLAGLACIVLPALLAPPCA